MEPQKLTFFHPDQDQQKSLHLVQEGISAGFPSPADDFKELRISIDQEVVRNEEATFYARVSGESMQGAGLDDGAFDRLAPAVANLQEVMLCAMNRGYGGGGTDAFSGNRSR